MPEAGSGLVAGYQGRGAATILAGDEQSPLAILQGKKAVAKSDRDKQLASSQSAIGQLTGAWDRDVADLAKRRNAYIKLNSHWMQQGIDPRDPSNPEVFEANREAYSSLVDSFTATGQHNELYDASRELIAKDKEGKYDRETSELALEEWGALPLSERMNVPMPIPTLKPDEFTTSQYMSDIADMIGMETKLRKPYIDPATGMVVTVEEDTLPENWEERVKQGYVERYDKIIAGADGDTFKGDEGFAKFRRGVKASMDFKIKRTSKFPTRPLARVEKGKEEVADVENLVREVGRMQVFDTATLEGQIGQLSVGGNTVTDYYISSKNSELQFLAPDEQGNLAPLVSMNIGDASSFTKLVNFKMRGTMSLKQRKKFAESGFKGFNKQDKSVEINQLVKGLAEGEALSMDKVKKGGRFKRKQGNIFTSEKLIDIKHHKGSKNALWWDEPAKVEFIFEDKEPIFINADDLGALEEIVENSGAIIRDVLTEKGQGGTDLGFD